MIGFDAESTRRGPTRVFLAVELRTNHSVRSKIRETLATDRGRAPERRKPRPTLSSSLFHSPSFISNFYANLLLALNSCSLMNIEPMAR